MNSRISRRYNPIATQSSEDLPATVATYDNPVGSPPASPQHLGNGPASPQQFDDDADTAQSDPEPAELATAAVELSPTLGLASQPGQGLLQPRSPPVGPALVTAVAVAEDVVDETDMDVEVSAADEDDM